MVSAPRAPRRRSMLRALAIGWTMLAAWAAPASAGQEPGAWSAQDAISMPLFVDAEDRENPSTGADTIHPTVTYSPDGGLFFTVARFGELGCDCNIYRFRVYRTREVEAALRGGRGAAPVAQLDYRSDTSDGRGVRGARWSPDSAHVYFLGAREEREWQVERWSVRDDSLTRLTDIAGAVLSFDLRADSLVFSAIVDNPELDTLDDYPANFVRGWDMGLALDRRPREAALYAARIGAPPRQLQTWRVAPWELRYWISPDGRWAVGVEPVIASEIAGRWTWTNLQTALARGRVLLRPILIDIEAGSVRPLLDMPTAAALSREHRLAASWSDDSRVVTLSGVTLPDEEDGSRLRVAAIAANVLDNGVTAVVGPPGGEEAAVLSRETTVEIVQGLNDPPALVASSGAHHIVLDDPVAASGRRPPFDWRLVEWRDEEGREWRGTLALPANAGGPVPLVVQIEALEPRSYMPDGTDGLPFFAGQLYAQAGMAVLNMSIRSASPSAPRIGPEEPRAFVAGLESGIRHLARAHGIAPDRVGLVGFSRGGYMVKYALANPGTLTYRAAIAADAADLSYFQMLYSQVLSPWGELAVAQFPIQYGGQFWSNEVAWLDSAPGFNVDRIATPLLLTAGGTGDRGTLVAQIEMFAGMRILGRPVDMVFFPEGSHVLTRPRERIAAMEIGLDWMSFWLLGREDPSPRKAAQFAHWRRLAGR